MNKEEIINHIRESKDLYLKEARYEKEKLLEKAGDLTGQQISSSLTYIEDMESRAYALKLLLEDIEMGD